MTQNLRLLRSPVPKKLCNETHAFRAEAGGSQASLLKATDGNFYGTSGGGGSRFGVVIGGTTTTLYLLDGFRLGANAGPGPRRTIDAFVDRLVKGNQFKPFGT